MSPGFLPSVKRGGRPAYHDAGLPARRVPRWERRPLPEPRLRARKASVPHEGPVAARARQRQHLRELQVPLPCLRRSQTSREPPAVCVIPRHEWPGRIVLDDRVLHRLVVHCAVDFGVREAAPARGEQAGAASCPPPLRGPDQDRRNAERPRRWCSGTSDTPNRGRGFLIRGPVYASSRATRHPPGLRRPQVPVRSLRRCLEHPAARAAGQAGSERPSEEPGAQPRHEVDLRQPRVQVHRLR